MIRVRIDLVRTRTRARGRGGEYHSATPDVAGLTSRDHAAPLPLPPLPLAPWPLLTPPLFICTVAAGGALGSVGGASAGKAPELSRDSYGDERDRDIDRDRSKGGIAPKGIAPRGDSMGIAQKVSMGIGPNRSKGFGGDRSKGRSVLQLSVGIAPEGDRSTGYAVAAVGGPGRAGRTEPRRPGRAGSGSGPGQGRARAGSGPGPGPP